MSSMLRVVVSSTSQDLKAFRQVVKDAVLDQGWHPVRMEHFGTGTGGTVEECVRKVEGSDLVVLLVAFRRGWVPAPGQGGDGESSVTALERAAARRFDGTPAAPDFLADRGGPTAGPRPGGGSGDKTRSA